MGILAENRMRCWEQGRSHCETGSRVHVGQQGGNGVSMLSGCIGDNARASKHMCTIKMSSGSFRLSDPAICVVNPKF